MNQLPFQLLSSLKNIKGFNLEAFENIHASGEQLTSIRINPNKQSTIPNPGSQIHWTEFGFYLDSRPSFTFDPLFHAGCYYVQEASSMFLEQALKQTVDLSTPLKVLDLCAAPGGKSTHIHSLITKDSLLVSNEVIRSRANVLKANIIKWGCENVVVTNNDPAHFSKMENYFDVIVVDAPCSGSGLFRRDPSAIEEWSENNIALCSQRQQRILADVWPALKKDGILIYSTCSYSIEEDEEIMDWVTRQLPSANCKLKITGDWNITETISKNGNTGYRFWPDKVRGEGFFLTCFQKKDGDVCPSFKVKKRVEPVNKKETELLEKWIKTDVKKFIKHLNTVYAWPGGLVDDFNFILENLRVIYSGILVGELMRDKLVPDHALSMSTCTSVMIGKIELSIEAAVKYLQRKDIQVNVTETGWQLASFEGHSLGWMNVLANRINNYYPKELRILKDI